MLSAPLPAVARTLSAEGRWRDGQPGSTRGRLKGKRRSRYSELWRHERSAIRLARLATALGGEPPPGEQQRVEHGVAGRSAGGSPVPREALRARESDVRRSDDVGGVHALIVASGSVPKRTRGCVTCGTTFEVNERHAEQHRFCRPACRARQHRRDRKRTLQPTPPTPTLPPTPVLEAPPAPAPAIEPDAEPEPMYACPHGSRSIEACAWCESAAADAARVDAEIQRIEARRPVPSLRR
jgi:hypothetical protein